MKVFLAYPQYGRSTEEIEFACKDLEYKALPMLCADYNKTPGELDIIDIPLKAETLRDMVDIMYKLDEADIVALSNDWESDRACKMIVALCEEYGKLIFRVK